MTEYENLKNICGIYKLTNKINNKIYIGKSIDILKRFYGHQRDYRSNNPITRAIKKYGWDNFSYEILYDSRQLNNKELLALETAFIDFFDATNPNIGYNVCLFATDKSGIPMSKRQKQLLSKIRKGKYCGNLNPFYGRNHSQISKQKMALYRQGKKATEETKRKISQSHLGHQPYMDYKGKNNPRFDNTTYTFINTKTKKTFEGTRFDFCQKFKLATGNVCNLLHGKSYSVKGWTKLLLGNLP